MFLLVEKQIKSIMIGCLLSNYHKMGKKDTDKGLNY